MRIAIPVTDGMVEGPGEAREVVIYESDPSPIIVDRFANPAISAISSPGIWMLRSAVDRHSKATIVSEIGPHAFDYASGRIDLYNGRGLSAEDAVRKFISGSLTKITGSTHHQHLHH